MDVKKRFGIAVREKRQAAGVSQEELAVRINADLAYVSRVEFGGMDVMLETVQGVEDELRTDS